MSVLLTSPVRYRGFQGYGDPSLPTSHWFIGASLLGDASGGQRSFTFEFASAGLSFRNSQWYSLEEVYVFDTSNTAKAGQLNASNFAMNVSPNVIGGGLFISIDLEAGQTRASLTSDAQAMLRGGFFLGRQNGVGTSTAIIIDYPNVNGATLIVTAGGYVWSPRSNLVPGGPSRPPVGLYGP